MKEVKDEFWKTSPRNILQYVGTELFKNNISTVLPDVGSDIWIKVVENKILGNPDKKYVITDVRFENELAFIKKYNGITIKVTRDMYQSVQPHVSEWHIDTMIADYDIENNETLDQIYKKLDFIITIIEINKQNKIK